MWERFSFYGMRALLTLYLLKHFLYSDARATGVYGAYIGMTYALPVLGGLLADRYLGARRAVIYGGILLCLGHLTMAFEGVPVVTEGIAAAPSRTAELMLFLALATIATGVGFLKPNISTMVGSLYSRGDVRRDSGFTFFYMGINLGAFMATLVVGYIGETWGWRYGFGLAGIGMIVGLTIFLWGQRFLHGAGEAPDLARLRQPLLPGGISREYAIYGGGLLLVLMCWYLVQRGQAVGGVLLLTLVVSYGWVLYQAMTRCNAKERGQLVAVLVLTFFSVAFWVLEGQAGSSMTLFTDRVVDRTLGTFEVRTSNFQSLNPLFIVLLAPLFSMLWVELAKRGLKLNLAVKFALGILQAGLGFWMLVIGINLADEAGMVPIIWLVLAYLIHTMGELCLSPVGLSMVTRLTVPHMVGLMMGNWFLAAAFAGWLAGQMARLAAVDTSILQAGDTAAMMDIYATLFGRLGWIGLGIGALLLVLAPFLSRLSGERRQVAVSGTAPAAPQDSKLE